MEDFLRTFEQVQNVTLIIIGVYALIAIFEGTRRLATDKDTVSAIKLITIGSFFCLSWIGLNLYTTMNLNLLYKPSTVEVSEVKLPENWRDDLPALERELNSKTYASLNYLKYGVLLDYISIDGTRQPYCPKPEEILSRKQILEDQIKLESAIGYAYTEIFKWLISGVIAALLGWCIKYPTVWSKLGFTKK